MKLDQPVNPLLIIHSVATSTGSTLISSAGVSPFVRDPRDLMRFLIEPHTPLDYEQLWRMFSRVSVCHTVPC